MKNRVVITALGPLTPRAAVRAPFWEFLCRGNTEVEDSSVPTESKSVVPWKVCDSWLSTRAPQLRQMDRLGRLVVAATDLALSDAELDLTATHPEDVGIVFGSGYGCLATNIEYMEGILERGSRLGNPTIFQNTVPNAATGYASLAHGIRGPSATICSGWVAGLEAIDFGFQRIAEGQARVMIIVSADCLCSQLVESFSLLGRLSPSGTSRPFDYNRDGTVLSEGACAVVLEDLNSAANREARIFAEILGIGQSSSSIGDPSRAVTRAVAAALSEAKAKPEQVQTIVSSANGTKDLDAWEGRGLTVGLGQHAAEVPTTCPKSLLGETLGSAGTFGIAVAALALRSGWVPATARHFEPDPDCRLNVQVGGTHHFNPEMVLVSSLGEEGSALVALLGRPSA